MCLSLLRILRKAQCSAGVTGWAGPSPAGFPGPEPGSGAAGEPGPGTAASAEQVDSVGSRPRAAGATRGQGLAPLSSWVPGWDGRTGCLPWTSPSRGPALKTSPFYFGPGPALESLGSRLSSREPGPGAGKGLAARIPLTDPGTAIGQG